MRQVHQSNIGKNYSKHAGLLLGVTGYFQVVRPCFVHLYDSEISVPSQTVLSVIAK